MNNAKTFRLFISSTFSDFALERQVLHERVFPKIDEYCIKKGYQFQPVDLRWGVSEEAQLDQKTLELCLNEVKACKHYPHPNFLIMSGNRYGWIPLPYAIQKNEFEAILDFYADNSSALKLLKEWYAKDTNHLVDNNRTYAYVLKYRAVDGPYKDWQEWEKLENSLRELLQSAAEILFDKTTAKYKKYFLSATEAEVEEGIFQYLNPTSFQVNLQKEQKDLPNLDKNYVFGFLREIDNINQLDLSNERAKLFVDKNQTKAKAFQEALHKVLIQENSLKVKVELRTDTNSIFVDTSYLNTFELFMIEKFKDAIDKQIQEAEEISSLKQEHSEQLRFKVLKTETFFGREEELQTLQEYINSSSTQALMIHGVSGIGKSSFVAKAISEAEEALTHNIIYRFIGVTAQSSNIRTLLESLITDLADRELCELPEIFEEDSNVFNAQVKVLFLSIKEPTVIVLDALDQLQHKDYLQWLPLELPSNLKIILSMLDQKGYEHYYDLLTAKIDKNSQLEIRPISQSVASSILNELLKKEKRALTPSQHSYVLEQVNKSDSSPLYLKIAFLEIKTWKATDENENLSIGVQEVIKEFIDNLSDKFHHDRTIVHKILGLIAASKDGLSEKEILNLLSDDEAILTSLEKFTDLTLKIDGKKIRRFPMSIWARLFEQLKPFMNERLIDGQNLLSFFHRQIDEAVRDYIYEKNRQELHVELANYFLSLQDEKRLWNKRYYNLHMLDEVPYQLFQAQDTQRLKEILFNLEFAGSVYDHHKQTSFTEILEKAALLDGITEDELYPWVSFYREKEHLITKLDEERYSPSQTLFQLAYEDGENSPLSEASHNLIKEESVDFIWIKRENCPTHYQRSGLLKVFMGHTKRVSGVKILNDGRILSYSEDGSVWLWSSEGKPLAVLEGHPTKVEGVEIFDDGRILSYSAARVCIWSSEGEFLSVIDGHTDAMVGVETLSSNRMLFYFLDGSLSIYSSEGESLAELKGHVFGVEGVKILSDGRILSFAWDGLRLWSNEGASLAVLEGHTDVVDGAHIFSDGRILSFSSDTTLRIWSHEGEALAVLEGHTKGITEVKILNDGRVLSCSEDGSLRLWSSEGIPLAVLEGHTSSVKGAEILSDGCILSYSADKTVRLWSSEGVSLAVLDGHTDAVMGVQVLSDGRILSYSADKTMRLSSSKGELLAVLEGHTDSVEGVHLLSDERILSYAKDGTLRLWNSKHDTQVLGTVLGHTDSINSIEILHNKKLLSCSKDTTLRLYSSEGVPTAVLRGHTSNVAGFKVLSDGRILSYSADGTLRLWSSEGESLAVLQGHTDGVTAAHIFSDGRILSCSIDNTLRFWSSEGKLLRILEGHTSWVNDAKILDDGRILSFSGDKTMRLWSAEGEPLAVLEGLTDKVLGAKVLHDGKILSYARNKKMRLWSAEGEPLRIWDEKFELEGSHPQILNSGEVLYATENTLRFWSVGKNHMSELQGHNDLVEGVQIFGDDSILSYAKDDTLRLWIGDNAPVVLKGHANKISGTKILHDEKIISYSVDGSLRLWSREGAFMTCVYLSREAIELYEFDTSLIVGVEGSNLLFYDLHVGSEKIIFDNIKDKNGFNDGI